AGGLEGGQPDMGPEPPAGYVPVGLNRPAPAWLILPGGPAPRAVAGISTAAVLAAALTGRVPAERAVLIPPPSSVGSGKPEGSGIGDKPQRPWRKLRHGEEQVIGAE